MVNVITPMGRLLTVKKATGICVKVFCFNGGRRVFMEVAKDINDATAIALETCDVGLGVNNEVVIGNLKPNTVAPILRSLGSDQYYDFTQFGCQKVKEFEDVVFDNGVSEAFSSETLLFMPFNTFGDRFGCLPMQMQPATLNTPIGTLENDVNIWDDEDGLEEGDEEVNYDEN